MNIIWNTELHALHSMPMLMVCLHNIADAMRSTLDSGHSQCDTDQAPLSHFEQSGYICKHDWPIPCLEICYWTCRNREIIRVVVTTKLKEGILQDLHRECPRASRMKALA